MLDCRAMRVLCLALGLALSLAAGAQAFPSRPVHFVVPNAPGGAIDIMARLFAQRLQPLWGQPALVDYKPGAGTALGSEFVARAAPDGHTLLFGATAHVINPNLRRLRFDTAKDFSGITLYGISHIVLCATPALPANTLAELIALARRRPGELSYASPGSGSALHLAGEQLKAMAGIDLLHVPFKGSGPAFPEVFAGRVDLIIDPLLSSLNYIRSGKLKALAIASRERTRAAPGIPTIAETLPGFEAQSMFGVLVPSATPREVVRKLNADFLKVLQIPAMRAKLEELGIEPVGNTPEQFDAYIRDEIERRRHVVKAAGIKLD
ncbi:MAG: tripartite tricarboxylate transporter substrate binding protein [Betaproteobacteria bacterium]